MALVFLGVLFYLPPGGFLIFISLGTAVGAWEWANLAGISIRYKKAGYLLLVAALVLLCSWFLAVDTHFTLHNEAGLKSLFLIALFWWCVALLWVQGYPSSSILWGSTPVRLVMGVFVLVPTWIGLLYIRTLDQGSWLVLLLVAAVSFADIGAYFTGKLIGKRRLAASVSPGKSWEGFLGGFAASLLLAGVVGHFWAPSDRLWMLLLVAPAALISVLGDLLESMVKRHRGVKDSGLILPGHGGVLDRVDGMTAAVPVFAFILLISGMRF